MVNISKIMEINVGDIQKICGVNKSSLSKFMGIDLESESTYGISWDESNSSPTCTRTGDTAGQPTGQSLSDAYLPVQALMKRCVINDSGVVQYYLCSTDSTLKADCSTAANIDGTDGQVMVEIPKFYYSYDYSGTTHSWSISLTQQAGFELHPAFNKNGSEVDYRYMSAYEGSMYDASLSQMVPAANISDNMYASGDKLCSVTASGIYPKTNERRSEYRAMAAERGTGWRQQDYDLVSAIQLLYVTEYASWYSQSVIGAGRTNLSGGTWTAGSYIGICGLSNSDGNGTNAVQNGGSSYDTDYMTYRGVENFFGNVWKWVDGFNINNGIPYVSNTDTDFADNTATGAGETYSRPEDITTASGITLPQGTNSYQVTLERINRGFLPASVVGGSSSTYITDYYYQNTGWRVASLGGNADNGGLAGFFCWRLYYSSSIDSTNLGGRVCF